jgi:Peptidase A4 family
VRQYRFRPILVVCAFVGFLITACSPSITIGRMTIGAQRTPHPVVVESNTEPARFSSTSENWSGYSIRKSDVTSITATWQVPQVTGSINSDSSTWIGIGGINSPTLIQAGTDQQVQDGRTFYFAWIEMLPDEPQVLHEISILPGDTVTVTISAIGTDLWSIAINDHDANQSTTKKVNYHSCGCSAEWIEEAPSLKGRTAQLADFSSVTFTNINVTIQGTSGTAGDFSARAIRMVNRTGQTLVQPQELHDDYFSLVDIS